MFWRKLHIYRDIKRLVVTFYKEKQNLLCIRALESPNKCDLCKEYKSF